MCRFLTVPNLKNVAYIRIVKFAVGKAAGYKIEGHNNDGFTFEEIRQDTNIERIDEQWLCDTLPSICSVYLKDDTNAREKPSSRDLKAEGTKLVIKSDEFMRFVSLIDHRRSIIALRVAIGAIAISIILSACQLLKASDVVKVDQGQLNHIIKAVQSNPRALSKILEKRSLGSDTFLRTPVNKFIFKPSFLQSFECDFHR